MNRRVWLAVGWVLVIAWLGCGKAPEPGTPGGTPSQAAAQAPGAEQPAHAEAPKKVREPAVAGQFYPDKEQDLAKQVDGFLAAAKPLGLKGVRGLVVPHAGYPYSGPTAGVAYRQIEGADFRTVIVMGPSHRARFTGAALPDVEAFRTPLGLLWLSPRAAELGKAAPFAVNPPCEVERPEDWRRARMEVPPFGHDTPHTWEHSVEVQLPFLQRTLKDFQLIPVVFGDVDAEQAAKALEKFVDQKTLIVASSDLSHYHPYEDAKQLDAANVRAICDLDVKWLADDQTPPDESPCGRLPILTLVHIARQKGWKAKLLDYRNSGDTAGDKSAVVGYAAIAFVEGGATPSTQPAQAAPVPSAGYTPEERKYLLGLARRTLVDVVNQRGIPDVDAATVPAKLREVRACFVTLRENGELRGCVGHIFPSVPLYQSVTENAMSAALRDFRFDTVRRDELDQIEIEISVLTVPKPLEFSTPKELLEKLRPGEDGVVLRLQGQQATFLPQVWEELPAKETFLGRLSEKARLPSMAWKSPDAAVLTYQVEAFEESQYK